jgi:hypothetical protein
MTCAMVAMMAWVLTLGGADRANAAEKKPDKPYALIFGTVWGPDHHVVYGVKVKIRRITGKKAEWEVYSDHSGEFAQRVPAGPADYVLSARRGDYKSRDGSKLRPGKEVTVHVESDERVDVGLHLMK